MVSSEFGHCLPAVAASGLPEQLLASTHLPACFPLPTPLPPSTTSLGRPALTVRLMLHFCASANSKGNCTGHGSPIRPRPANGTTAGICAQRCYFPASLAPHCQQWDRPGRTPQEAAGRKQHIPSWGQAPGGCHPTAQAPSCRDGLLPFCSQLPLLCSQLPLPVLPVAAPEKQP